MTGKEGPDAGGRRVATSAALLAAAAVLAVHAALAWIAQVPEPRALIGDEAIYLGEAQKIADGTQRDPHPFWPPLPYYYLAGILSAGGMTALRWVQTALLVGAALALGDLTRHLSGSSLAGLVAGWLVLVYPPLVAFTDYLWPELLHLFLFLLALWILVRRSDHGVWLAGAGLVLGLAILTKYLLWPFLPVLLVALALEAPARRRAVHVACVALGVAAVLVPAAVAQGRWSVGVRVLSSPVFNLWVGLNDVSRKNFVEPVAAAEFWAYQASAPTFEERNAILLAKIRQRLRERGVLRQAGDQLGRQYFRLFDKDSVFTDQLPGGALSRHGRGYAAPPRWLAGGLRWTSYALYSAGLAGAVVGFLVCPHRGRRWLGVCAPFLVYNLALFFVLHVKSRYRIQLLPFVFLYTGCAVAWGTEQLGLWQRRGELWKEPLPPWAWPAATLAAALLLFLAWGRVLLD